MREGLLEHLFPDAAAAVAAAPDSPAVKLLYLGLQGTDERVRADKSVTPTFLFAVLLWPSIRQAFERMQAQHGADVQTLLAACDAVTTRQQSRVAVPKRFTLPLREIVGLQPRFAQREGRRALRLLDHPRFRAAYDFLLLRAAAGEVEQEVADWWTKVQTMSVEERTAMVEQGPHSQSSAPAGRKRRRRRRRRAPPA
jgi:poly(A) polymerase